MKEILLDNNHSFNFQKLSSCHNINLILLKVTTKTVMF